MGKRLHSLGTRKLTIFSLDARPVRSSWSGSRLLETFACRSAHEIHRLPARRHFHFGDVLVSSFRRCGSVEGLRGGGIFGDDVLVDPSSAHELILEVLNDDRVDDIDGVQIIWNGDGQLEITSPSGSRRDVQTITARHNPEEFADASCSRIRIDLTGPRDAASVEYKIRIASGAAFCLAAFALRDGVPIGRRGPLSRVLTINGGVAGEFSPSVASVSQRPVGDGVRVSLFGVLLNRVDDVRLLGRDSQIITLEWTAHGSDSITFQLPNDVAMRVRFVQARDATGRGSVEPCDLRASVHPPVKNQILVRLHEGQSFDRLQAVAGVRDVDWAVRWAETPEGARRNGAADKYPQFALVNLAENGTVPEVLARMRARPEVYSADSLTEGEMFLQGRRVADPLIGDSNADAPTVSWLGDDSTGNRAKAGMYLLRVERAGQVVSRRFLLIR